MIPWAHPSPQPKRHLDRFSGFCRDDRRVILYFIMGRPSPPKLPIPMGGCGPTSNTWFPGSTRVLNLNGIYLDRFSRFLQGSLVWQTERQTDRPRYSVGNNRPHLPTYYGRCGLKRHILAWVHVVWATMRKNPSTGLNCRWVSKKRHK